MHVAYENTVLKAALVSRIGEIMRERGLSQTAAAQLTTLTQSDFSALLGGRLRGMSTDRLVRTLCLLGARIEIGVWHDDTRIGDVIQLSNAVPRSHH